MVLDVMKEHLGSGKCEGVSVKGEGECERYGMSVKCVRVSEECECV